MRQIQCLQLIAKLLLFCFLRHNYSFMAYVCFTDVVCHYSWNTTKTQQEPDPPPTGPKLQDSLHVQCFLGESLKIIAIFFM